MDNFNNQIILNNKVIKFRKWKVKDKFALEQSKTKEEIRNALVYNCLENPKTILDETEYEYVLSCIRDKSLNKPSTYTFTCDECEEDFNHEVKVSEITKVDFNGYKPIQTKNFKIELQDIQNRQFYEDKMSSKSKTELMYFDFILHIKSINDDDTLTFDKILEIFNELDVDEFEEIVSKWNEIKMKLVKIEEIECPHCHTKMKVEYDTISRDFFPNLWNK